MRKDNAIWHSLVKMIKVIKVVGMIVSFMLVLAMLRVRMAYDSGYKADDQFRDQRGRCK